MPRWKRCCPWGFVALYGSTPRGFSMYLWKIHWLRKNRFRLFHQISSGFPSNCYVKLFLSQTTKLRWTCKSKSKRCSWMLAWTGTTRSFFSPLVVFSYVLSLAARLLVGMCIALILVSLEYHSPSDWTVLTRTTLEKHRGQTKQGITKPAYPSSRKGLWKKK